MKLNMTALLEDNAEYLEQGIVPESILRHVELHPYLQSWICDDSQYENYLRLIKPIVVKRDSLRYVDGHLKIWSRGSKLILVSGVKDFLNARYNGLGCEGKIKDMTPHAAKKLAVDEIHGRNYFHVATRCNPPIGGRPGTMTKNDAQLMFDWKGSQRSELTMIIDVSKLTTNQIVANFCKISKNTVSKFLHDNGLKKAEKKKELQARKVREEKERKAMATSIRKSKTKNPLQGELFED